MSSDQRVYVYLQLPQTLEVVTAGAYTLALPEGVPVGTFRYSPRYLARQDAVTLEPFTLPLSPRPQETVKLKGIFGALRDASPDAWGRRIIERELGRTDLTEADYLLHSPEDRVGALSFGRSKEPPGLFRDYNKIIQLEALLRLAERVAQEDDRPREPGQAQVDDLLRPGTSMGGARPKNVVEDDDGLWVAKFPDRGDRWNNARVEHAMLMLAQECAIRTAHSRVVTIGGSDVVLVKRFDRERVPDGYLRHRMVSGLTILDADDTAEGRALWSYLRLADELRRRSSRPNADLEELFRRMVFNALVSNTDDHPRNHALIATTRDFELSPAYDLSPVSAISQEKRDLAMTAGVFNRYANRANLLSGHARFKLSFDDANAIVDQLQSVVRQRWRSVLRQHGVSESDCERVAGAFDYPGFDLDPAVVLAEL